jgi:uncharacterized membrane protein YeaQ/YmgE (transglycosylase-associated protein family)
LHIEPELYPWFSVIAILWGLVDCFLGYKIFKVTIGLLGGLAGAVLGQFIAQSAGAGDGGQLAGLLIGALLGAGTAFLLYVAAVFLAGFGFGATLAILLLAHFNHMVALLASIVVGVVAGFIAVKMQKVLIILATSLLGAFRALLATCYFTSQLDWFYYFRNPAQIPAMIDNTPWLFPSILVLAAVGSITQFELGAGAGKPAKKKKGD